MMLIQTSSVSFLTQGLMMAAMPSCEGASSIQPLFDLVKAIWHLVPILTVRTMRNVMVLSNIDGIAICRTIALLVAERFHADVLAVLDVIFGERSLIVSFGRNKCKRVCVARYTIFPCKRHRKLCCSTTSLFIWT